MFSWACYAAGADLLAAVGWKDDVDQSNIGQLGKDSTRFIT
ncbi:MAG: hypothetical protein NTW52_13695 [Planctomycetota bacterium]|nr:hypothetical protein [Planctomycetota bacterium]